MDLKKHGRVFLNGIIFLAPMIICVWVVFAAVLGLDRLVRQGMQWCLDKLVSPGTHPWWESAPPGFGFLLGLVVIYIVGLLARTWLLSWPLRLAEIIVEHIPLIKSLYSAIKDLLQFLGSADKEDRGRPALVRSEDGKVVMLGLITQEKPGRFLPEGDQERIAVYLPMSYQIGGYTLFVPKDSVEELPELSVEELMKLTLTAGIGPANAKLGPTLPQTPATATGDQDGDQGSTFHAEPGQDAADAAEARPAADERGQ
jgi:uncharacterized membrane protein